MKKLLFVVLAIAVLLSCKKEEKNVQTLSGLNTKDFVAEVDGKKVELYILKNARGLEACITNFGGRIVTLLVPDRYGDLKDVVLGYSTIDEYLKERGSYGAIIGRFGNRIKNAMFTLDDVVYQLPKNNNGHCLHSGPEGFNNQVWDAEQIDAQTLKLTYLSKDGESGFPGNLNVTVIYKLTDQNEIDIHYEATTDKATVVNLTNHSYFNISGDLGTSIYDHYVYINADSFLAVDETLIPTEIVPVENTPMDLRVPTLLRESIYTDYPQVEIGRGYDHNWILNTKGDVSQLAAKVYHDGSGIVMDVYTNEPGVQFYSGNFRNSPVGKNGITYIHRGALCLETQHYPDSPNNPSYPSTVLRPGEKYVSRCIYAFKTVPTPINQ